MTLEKEKIISFLKKNGKTALSKIHRFVKVPYYKLKYDIIPEMKKEGLIIVEIDKSNRYIHISIKKREGETYKK